MKFFDPPPRKVKRVIDLDNMVIIHCAYTEPINPFDARPVLTRQQVWNGLQRKVRRAQDFVPVIDACRVLEERGNEVVREAHFKAGETRAAGTVREVCRSYYPTKVDFVQPSGAVITNTISDGANFTDAELLMTYTFEWRHEDVEEGSERAKELAREHLVEAKMAVHNSIESMRKMAAAGELD